MGDAARDDLLERIDPAWRDFRRGVETARNDPEHFDELEAIRSATA